MKVKQHKTAFSTDPSRRQHGGKSREVDNKHRLWIKSQRSIINGSLNCVDPHHVKKVDQSVGKPTDSAGKRVDDKYLIPLGRGLHDELHEIGEPAFEKKYGVDLVKLALGFYAHSGDQVNTDISINWTIFRAREMERASV